MLLQQKFAQKNLALRATLLILFSSEYASEMMELGREWPKALSKDELLKKMDLLMKTYHAHGVVTLARVSITIAWTTLI